MRAISSSFCQLWLKAPESHQLIRGDIPAVWTQRPDLKYQCLPRSPTYHWVSRSDVFLRLLMKVQPWHWVERACVFLLVGGDKGWGVMVVNKLLININFLAESTALTASSSYSENLPGWNLERNHSIVGLIQHKKGEQICSFSFYSI